MIEYKVDKKPISETNAHIRDMAGVLKEVATTYRILQETIAQQGAALSSPSIDAFRRELQQLVRNGISQAEAITEYSQKLAVVSEQATKHLTAFEDHFSATLQKHVKKEI